MNNLGTHANGGDIDGLPLDGHASYREDLLDGRRDLRTDAISGDQSDLRCAGSKSSGIDRRLGHLKVVTLIITI